MSSNFNKALTRDQRIDIEKGIKNGSTKQAIADFLGKDNSTIGKEIKLHRYIKSKCQMPLECSAYRKCKHGRNCVASCPDYVPFKCSRRDRSPGACNGCSGYSKCRFTKYWYDAGLAQREYEKTLVESREGFNVTQEEVAKMAEVIVPLIKDNHQSPYVVLQNHPELGICEKTLYTYIDAGIFDSYGLKNIDLHRKVGRRITKKASAPYKKRQDKAYLLGRTYEDYLDYMDNASWTSVVYMDTVYNDVTNGPFLQTFKWEQVGFFFMVLHDTKTADDMDKGIYLLEEILGPMLFSKYCSVILTDRGGEFVHADKIENRDDGTLRTRIFYCDAMASGQKGTLEQEHETLRYFLPKNTERKKYDFRMMGLVNQDKANLIVSHIDSYPVESLGGRTPIETTKFFWPHFWEKMQQYGIKEIEKDKVVMNSSVLKAD